MAPAVRAVLLVGPTGSGKSPVGALLERRGGFRHFDFGAELRAAAAGRRGLSPADTAFVRSLLATHALLPDDRFDVARELLDAFLAASPFDPARERLVLNGLPRHVAQAQALARTVRVDAVVVLEADAATVAARVARRRRGEGLDHAGRDDDSPEAVARKLAIYTERTRSLIAWYEAQEGVRVVRVHVGAATPETELAEQVAAALADAHA